LPTATSDAGGPPYDVVCLSCSCWDVLATCDDYPALDEKRPLEGMSEQGGGQAATAAAAVARLGGRAAFVGRVGDDAAGSRIRESLEQAGVDISWGLATVAGARSQWAFCVAERASGRRAILWRPATTGELDAKQIDRERLLQTRVLLIDGHRPAASLAAARWAHGASIPVVADLERPVAHLDELLRLASYPILPEALALELTDAHDWEQAGARLAGRTDGTLVLTLGARGSAAFPRARPCYQRAFEIPVVDTTGAGDVYHGAFALAVARGEGLAPAMRYASAAAALSCRALGGRAGLPTDAEVGELLARGEPG